MSFPERTEEEHIRLVLQPNDVKKYYEELRAAFPDNELMINADQINGICDITIEYDNVVKRI